MHQHPRGAPDTAAARAPDAARQPWDQLPGEPDRWYGRFQVYLELGPTRTLQAAVGRSSLGRDKPLQYGGRWNQFARAWFWRERAHAWDAAQRNLLALSERNLRAALHHRRVEMMEDALEEVRAALDAAQIAEFDREQARKSFGQLRRFLCDLLALERKEFERIDFERDDPYNGAQITADELRAAQRALEEERRGRAGADEWEEASKAALRTDQNRRRQGRARCRPADLLVVCPGAGTEVPVALGLWQEVRAASGLRFSRVLKTTGAKLAAAVHLGRSMDHPAQFMHMALPAAAAGVEVGGRPLQEGRLRTMMAGLRVLLLADYRGEDGPAWAQDVPCVVTVAAGGDAGELAAFARAFWIAIGEGEEAEAALEAAGACAPGVRAGGRLIR